MSNVYVIEAAYQAVKIGVARNPEARRRMFQTGCPLPLVLHRVIPCGPGREAYKLEEHLHQRFSYWRLPSGEWFDIWPVLDELMDREDHEWWDDYDACVAEGYTHAFDIVEVSPRARERRLTA